MVRPPHLGSARPSRLGRVEPEIRLEAERSVFLGGVADSLHAGRVVRRRKGRQLGGKRLREYARSEGLLEGPRKPQALGDPDDHVGEARPLKPTDPARPRWESSEIQGDCSGKNSYTYHRSPPS